MTSQNPFAAPANFEFAEPTATKRTPSLFARWISAWIFIGLAGAVFGMIGGPIGIMVGGIIAFTVGLVVTLCVFGIAAAALGNRGMYRHQIWVNGLCGAVTGASSTAVLFQSPEAGIFVLAAACVGAAGGVIPAAFRLAVDAA